MSGRLRPHDFLEARLTPEQEQVWLDACRQFRKHFDADLVWRKAGEMLHDLASR